MYYTSVKNDIFLTPFGENEPTGSTIDGFFVNLDKTRRVGLEAGTAYTFPAGHSLYLNYSYTRATFQTDAEVFSIREADEVDGQPVINPFPTENNVTPGSRFPLVPDHQIKLGGLARIGRYVSVGADGRYTGKQYLRGDEANVTDQLDGYFVADARVGVEFGRWEINGIVTNVFQNESAIFGTFNINQGNPAGLTVERFLTPNARRAFRLVVRTTLGGTCSTVADVRRRHRLGCVSACAIRYDWRPTIRCNVPHAAPGTMQRVARETRRYPCGAAMVNPLITVAGVGTPTSVRLSDRGAGAASPARCVSRPKRMSPARLRRITPSAGVDRSRAKLTQCDTVPWRGPA